ncbi:ABC transporter ATP-binding protein [Lactobacillus gasseri]|jgi:lipoprotein-releasing system ATP-binding protein lolD|uniref:Putative hemin import ATP-binding protein HrtA n=1 Tax=Lactobacillus gasseri TaxID=1596 RepID=A0ABY3BFZ1_LACGS|nr:ABC transporter ATP-binding protein [Lactobacillus gasseri]KXA24090.1 ABC transporter, ATP-binding protein [Lactobacillus gasseri]MCT7704131.1 ABC transporter ATP-binding protein [Lactobacillus gasseri]MCT7749765.1 ABC transporter ATP-binding protein [Lactobacillus gasseri]MCT7894130.1 ABC transporter ATP-binding protein [Lactobacillus gasseri]MCZ3483581.1 ABC transporter ATP-binding protein [Lactobacillus gasseri]
MSVIELKNISKSYGQGNAKVDALKDVNFEAKEGEVVLIEGPSGAGKSTFLTIAGALQKPTSGEVFIGGKDVTNYSPKQADALRLDKIGFVLQAYNLVPYLTVKEQFILVDKVKKNGNMSKDRLDNLLNELGIMQLINKYPKELSGGQQQRVAIARALYADPAIILADEPTASLDSEKVEEVGKLFKSLAKQKEKAIILVTHDLRLNKYSDKIYEMLDGRLSLKKG